MFIQRRRNMHGNLTISLLLFQEGVWAKKKNFFLNLPKA
jgi:hypothetical protein